MKLESYPSCPLESVFDLQRVDLQSRRGSLSDKIQVHGAIGEEFQIYNQSMGALAADTIAQEFPGPIAGEWGSDQPPPLTIFPEAQIFRSKFSLGTKRIFPCKLLWWV